MAPYDPLLQQLRTGALARTPVSNANFQVSFNNFYVAQVGTMTAPRTWTLPPASIGTSRGFVFADESGTVTGGNTITLAAFAGDTINGAATNVINTAYGVRRLISNGVNKWTVI